VGGHGVTACCRGLEGSHPVTKPLLCRGTTFRIPELQKIQWQKNLLIVVPRLNFIPAALAIKARGYMACGAYHEDSKARRKYKDSQCDAFLKVI